LRRRAIATLSILLLGAGVAEPSPAPSPTPALKEIIHVRSSPLCTTVQTNVLFSIEGLNADDHIVNASKPVLVNMGKAFARDSIAAGNHIEAENGKDPWMTVPGGIHDTDPVLVLNNNRLKNLVGNIVHNLAIIDSVLNDPTRFPAVAKTADDQKALQLKAELQAVADQQRRNLNVLNGLADTFTLQDLIAKGDGTQGALNEKFGNSKIALSNNDQDVSFKDVVSGPDRGRLDHVVNPTVDTDPAVSQPGTDLSNNPMARFYAGVSKIQQDTAQAESALTQTVQDVAAGCRLP